MKRNNNNKPIPSMVSEQSISLVVDDKPITISRDNPSYFLVRQAIKDRDWSRVRELIDVKEAVRIHTKGQIKVTENGVFYKDEQIHNVVSDAIMKALKEGLPIDGLVKFLDNLMENPSMRAREELYKFLEANKLVIDPEDGTFLGYKAVRKNYKDIFSGKFSNHIGAILEMDRRDVDDDPNRGCSKGFHVGSISYVNSFCPPDGIKLIVKVNPKDVVSVPREDARKLRTCRYEVIAHFNGELTNLMYDKNLVAIKGSNNSSELFEDDDDYFDDEYWDNEDYDDYD